MIYRAGLLWDSKLLFSRYIEESGVPCEHITPHMIAAPFYRGRFVALIIPTGFANQGYSCLLPALKASSSRIQRFVSLGGHLLVFGASSEREDAYDWLPLKIRYHHDYGCRNLEIDTSHYASVLLEGYDTSAIECDGYFTEHDGCVVASSCGNPVMIAQRVGRGEIVATTVHEYPSGVFLKKFCSAPEETLF
ncbi:MAG: hypothetical protein LUQ37_10215 [Methanoregulaceae archaeon]|nr:hypothetical protein [Methanoregulaceae archaeon]